MAALALPLIAALAPEIINLIAGLVHRAAPIAEAQHGPSTGLVKSADVFVSVMQNLVNAHAARTIAVLPDEPTVKVIIQAVVTSMKLAGVLGTSTPAIAVAAIPVLAVAEKWLISATVTPA